MKRKMSFLVAGLLCLSLCLGAEAAGTVTDTLTVRVGYYGMEQDRYVEVATYHWSELYDALPLHYEAYSFFRSTDDGTYNTVIDSAYGFYLADLLDYAGIYSGDISVVAFYTRDQSVGFFTSFTYADLFGTQRYYYNDLSAHISPVYDENGALTGYDGDEAWNDCWTVQPMLALEDSWVSYEIGTEHTAPNYSSLGTGNRFRLLFGQSYPLECRTNQSAKYTHTLFITLQGAPKITEEPPELDGTLGSHSATFQISVGQQALRDALAQYLDIASSDSSVLEITGITPSWGALTGIRPGKLASRMLEEGMTEHQVDRVLRDTYFVSPERRRLCIETAEASRRAKAELKPEDISLYVGIPFCPTRCAYCSFVSQSVERTLGLVEPYLEVLHREITDAARMVQETGLHIKSFYMGGGTPTTLSTDQMDRLLTHLNRSFDLSGCAEYCIEAGRPDTIDREKLQVLLDHGVDRISVNPQSLEDHVLTAIGRRHTARDVEEAMALATGMGFPHVNMDLIAGLPEDTPEGFRRTLDKCLSYGADNITVHTLSLKKGSRILLENFTIPSAEAVGEMLDYANAALRQADFRPYYLYRQKYMSGSFENTGWCISGAEGLYNIYIMEELHSILSLGAGGSTKMVDPVHQRIERVFHTKYPTEYIQRSEKLEENLSAFRQFHENMRG